MQRRYAACLLAVCCWIGGPAAEAAPNSGKTIVHAGTLLAVPGHAPQNQQSVIVENGRIVAVQSGYVEEEGARIVNLRSAFVMPGLMDLHTHLTGELTADAKLKAVTQSNVDVAMDAIVFARRTLEAGFTTVRNVGGNPEVMFGLRDGIAAGKVPGPRIFAAGHGLSGTGGHADDHGYRVEILELFSSSGVCDGADDCRRAVRAQVKRGSDWIKITATGGVLSETAAGTGQQLFDDELAAIIATAKTMGRKVAAHAHGVDGINAALRAGVTTIEHGTYSNDESFRLYKENDAWLVPTMLAGATVVEMAKNADFMVPAVRAKATRVGADMATMVRKAHAAGVRIAFGTDSGVSRHGDNAKEFGLLVGAGLSEMDALVTATVHAAEVLGLSDRLGTVEPGKLADLIAVDGNPLEQIDAMERVRFVMKEGQVFTPADQSRFSSPSR